MPNLKLLKAIQILRHSHKSVETIFTTGGCYEFYKFIKQMYPKAEAWYDGSHVYSLIDGHYYDITGEVLFTEMGKQNLRKMTKADKIIASDWGLAQYNNDKLNL